MKRVFAGLVVAALCAGCSEPLSPTTRTASPSASLSVEHPKNATPFKGTLQGTVTVTPLTPPKASVFISATGEATKLGQFSLEVPHEVDFSKRTGTGTYRFTAANGDQLIARFDGEALTSPPIVSIVEIAKITGGTGRFAGATGSFIAERVFDQTTGTTTGSFDGTIAWDGN